MKMTLFVAVVLCAPMLVAAQAQAQPSDSVPKAAQSKTYKSVGDTDLRLHILQPAGGKIAVPRPAIIFFFGGGWSRGSVNQFIPHARYFAERGMVAVLADYRVKSRHGVAPADCVEDAIDAMRWLRAHAAEFGIDEGRIVAAGGSAGGHLAACTALLDDADESGATKVSAKPNALVLFNPVLDMVAYRDKLSDERVRGWKRAPQMLSPAHQVGKDAPPTIIFHGTADTTVPFTQATRFCEEMKAAGNTCELVPFEGRRHAFFNYGRNDNVDYLATISAADDFLVRHGFLPPTE